MTIILYSRFAPLSLMHTSDEIEYFMSDSNATAVIISEPNVKVQNVFNKFGISILLNGENIPITVVINMASIMISMTSKLF